ncbi:hypothetical protein [Methylocapsa sp. S129]|uniref:hypothetical protein n=1 Tax=Methylocapsa sp. S129 TaxID=1641869 RepID=UPI00131C9F4B|nr:hypothetical protein [Methylocapsa sp. S129]
MNVGKEFDIEVKIEDDPKPSISKKKPRRVAVGKAFDAKATIGPASPESQDATTRTQIVWFVFAMGAIFLFGATLLGLREGQFGALGSVWSVVGPAYGGIAAYFFNAHRKR